MIQRERQQRILAYLAEHDVITVEEAMALLDSSPATIRRDFNELARANLAERTHGGLGRVRTVFGGMLPFVFREVQYSREKAALAQEAAKLLHAGDVLMVDGGTSTFHLAHALPELPMRVITNSVRLAAVLGDQRPGEAGIEVFLTGGYLYPQSGMLVGPMAVATLSQYRANWAFLSVGGISEDGIFNTNEFVVESERMMLQHSDQVVVLADHSKIGHSSMCRICGLENVGMLITDAYPENEEALKRFAEAGINVVEVRLPETRASADIEEEKL